MDKVKIGDPIRWKSSNTSSRTREEIAAQRMKDAKRYEEYAIECDKAGDYSMADAMRAAADAARMQSMDYRTCRSTAKRSDNNKRSTASNGGSAKRTKKVSQKKRTGKKSRQKAAAFFAALTKSK